MSAWGISIFRGSLPLDARVSARHGTVRLPGDLGLPLAVESCGDGGDMSARIVMMGVTGDLGEGLLSESSVAVDFMNEPDRGEMRSLGFALEIR